MLLPYYVASLNIEHAYYERMRQYEAFEGLCFVDTLDMAEAAADRSVHDRQHRARGAREAGCRSPSSSATRRTTSDRRARTTTTRNASTKWWTAASGRPMRRTPRPAATELMSPLREILPLGDRPPGGSRWDCLFRVQQQLCRPACVRWDAKAPASGFRTHRSHRPARQRADGIRSFPGTTHNVFGIQVGVGITLAVKKRAHLSGCATTGCRNWRETRRSWIFSRRAKVAWETLTPDAQLWIVPEHA